MRATRKQVREKMKMKGLYMAFGLGAQRALCALVIACCTIVGMHAADYAGITVDKATLIEDTTSLLVQDGGNYIKIEAAHLPATITYVPDSAFGPIPTAWVEGGDTLTAKQIFDNCQMQWQWELTSTNDAVVCVYARENASINIEPFVCHNSYSDTTAVVCDGIQWGGAWRDEPGEYTITITKPDGCDSIRTLHLSFFTPVDTDTTATAWDTFSWYGNTYTQSGDYTVSKIDANGCDYTHTLHLTILTTSYNYKQENHCDSLILNGEKITTSGEFVVDTTYTAEGNRIINVLVVTMGETYYGDAELTACDQYESLSGNIYTESGVYVDTIPQYNGCDAVITLTLIIESCDEAIDDVPTEQPINKVIENGQVFIIRNGERYNILGVKV